MFNEHAVIGGNTTVLTALNSSRFKAFNPFTAPPVECPQGASSATCRSMGANWQKGSKFGIATGPTNYQTPRTYRLSVGFKF